jgi:hypothetical protein
MAWVVGVGYSRVVGALRARRRVGAGRLAAASDGAGSADDDDAGEGRGTGNGGDHCVVHGCTSLQSAVVIRIELRRHFGTSGVFQGLPNERK